MSDTVRVLHVDDDPALLELTATFLERTADEFTVETSTSAESGLERLAETPYDCIVSDYDMPGQTGIEFLETVRQESPDLPFILFTGKGSEEVASDAISAGVTDYLQKQPGADQFTVLANRIRNAVSANRSAREAERMSRQLEQIKRNVTDVIWMTDLENGAVEFISDSFREVWGRSPEMVRKDPTSIVETIHPDDRDRISEALAERQVNPDGYEETYRIVQPDGEVRWVHSRASGVYEDGTLSRIVGIVTDITERTERERELERNRDLLAHTEALARTGGWEADVETGEQRWTDGTYVIHDIQPDSDFDPTVEAGTAFYHPADREQIERAVTRCMERGEAYEVELRLITAEDQLRWVRASGEPILEDGEIVAVRGAIQDITERKAQEHKREQIIERVTDAIVEVDDEWRFTLVNEQAETLYDMDEASLLGRSFWDVFEEARGTRFEEEYRQVMEAREPTSFTEYYDELDGWFEIEAYPDDDGGISFYFVEVSERRERRRELERGNRRLQYLEEAADIGYWEVDLETPEPYDVTLSEGVYNIHELPPDDSFDVERGIEFYHPEDRPVVERALERAMTEGEPYDQEVRLITATGRERWVHSVGEPVERDGEVVSIRGVFQDVTDRKRQEQALARQNERLDEFAGIVSHDLRNPLSVAAGRLELAQAACDSDHLDPLGDAIERMERIVDDVLWLAREGRDIGSTDPKNLHEALEDAWSIVADDADDATLVVSDYAGDSSPIEADHNRLSQLLENLFRNAIEHGGAGVTVTVGALDDGFYVEDDGPGIPEEQRAAVFDSGFSTSAEGTGFGLSIVEQVVRAHGWEIDLADGSDGGARFEITGVSFVAD